MNAAAADELGQRIALLVEAGKGNPAYGLLAPVLAQRTPFPLLARIGRVVGDRPLAPVNEFLWQIAAARTEGGWVVIGGALGQQLGRDLPGAFARCRTWVVVGDTWYVADILGERVPGPALLADFAPALELLSSWREDANRWVRRTVGVAVHFWARRSRGAREQGARAAMLLDLLEPMFEEWDMDAVKGIGWGLKTLGRYYPDLVTDWLAQQVGRRHRVLMLRKALAYLPDEQKMWIMGRIAR